MILRAKHHWFVYPFFKWYSKWIIKKHFKKIITEGNVTTSSKAVLLISNHVSWWDGFWAMYFNNTFIRKRFHFMMEEKQLRKYIMFNKIGGFSVRKNSRSALESINYSKELLSNSHNTLLMYPQGEIQSKYKSGFVFQKGVSRILSSMNKDIQVVFLVNLIDYFSDKKPTLFMYYGEYLFERTDIEYFEKSFNEFYTECLSKQLSIKG
jgi:1-acyl-sn-glycerol-3-phosphate acyltransferase